MLLFIKHFFKFPRQSVRITKIQIKENLTVQKRTILFHLSNKNIQRLFEEHEKAGTRISTRLDISKSKPQDN